MLRGTPPSVFLCSNITVPPTIAPLTQRRRIESPERPKSIYVIPHLIIGLPHLSPLILFTLLHSFLPTLRRLCAFVANIAIAIATAVLLQRRQRITRSIATPQSRAKE